MTQRRMDAKGVADVAARKAEMEANFKDSYDLNGRVWNAGEVVRVDGLAGDYKIGHFEGDAVQLFGGPRDRKMTRHVRVERLREMGAVTKSRNSVASRQLEWMRDAIAKTGRVEVAIPDDADDYALRLLKNQVFRQAYSCGLKGKFKLDVDKEKGLIIGSRKDLA